MKQCLYVCLHPGYHIAILEFLPPLHSSVGVLYLFASEQGRSGVVLGVHGLALWRLPQSLGHHVQIVRSVVDGVSQSPSREMSGS